MEMQSTHDSQNNIEEAKKLKDWHYGTSRLTIKLQESRQCKNRQTDNRNRIKSSERDTYKYRQLIFHKEIKVIQ